MVADCLVAQTNAFAELRDSLNTFIKDLAEAIEERNRKIKDEVSENGA